MSDLEEFARLTARLSDRKRMRGADKDRVVDGARERRCANCMEWKAVDNYGVTRRLSTTTSRAARTDIQSWCKVCQKVRATNRARFRGAK